jgi:hypothetical protein
MQEIIIFYVVGTGWLVNEKKYRGYFEENAGKRVTTHRNPERRMITRNFCV